MTKRLKPYQLHLLIFVAYLALAILLTWPTASHFFTHLPGDGGDDPAIAWNLWQLKFSLLNQPQNPFFSDMMFYPLGVNLAFYTLTVLNGLTSLPLLLNVGVVAASNLHMWFSFAVGGYGVFLLVRYILLVGPSKFSADGPAVRWSAAIAGLSYAFASSKLFYVSLGQFNIASAHWIPFAILFFIKMRRQPGQWRWPVLCALFVIFQSYAEITYTTFLVIFMAFYWLYWLLTDMGRRVIRWPYLQSAGILAGLTLLGLSPILLAMLPDLQAEGDFLVVGGGFADIFSADAAGFFVPTVLHPLLGDLVTQTNVLRLNPANPAEQQIYKGQHIFLGFTLLLLAGYGFWHYRRNAAARFWLISSVVFALLTLGPEIIINGQNTHLPGPFVYLQQLPFFKGNRYPSRYSVMLILSLAPLMALGLNTLLSSAYIKQKKQAVAIVALLAAGLFLFEHFSAPLPQSDMRLPAGYETIINDPDDFTVLDIPFAWRNGFRISGALTTGFMFGQFYQTGHQKPMLQGNTSRNPEWLFQYFTEAPILSSLRILQAGHPLPAEIQEADKAIAGEVLGFFDTKYIVVRPETPGYQNNPQATIPYIEAVLPVTKLQENDDLILYQVDPQPLPATVDLLSDSPLTSLYFAEGWGMPHGNIMAQRKTTRLLVPLNGQNQTVELTLRGPYNEIPFGEMWLEINGWRSERIKVFPEWQNISLNIPAEAVENGLNEALFHFSKTIPAPTDRADITVISAGEEAGNLGHIYLNGVDVSPNERGYNVAVIAPEGELIAVANFDTHLDPSASDSLAQFINNAPAGAIIAVAAKDEASAMLTDSAVAALQSIGGQVDPRGHFRAGHAIIGGKGDMPTQEAFDPFQPVQLTNGFGLTEPNITAEFQKITFQADAD